MNKKVILKYLLFATLGVLIVYFIQKNFTFREFADNLKMARYGYVLLSVFAGVVAVFIRGLRWKLLLEPLGYNTSLSNAYHATMSGYLVNLGIPRSGEVYRCAVFSKTDKIPMNILVGSVLSERVLDILMLFVVIFCALIFQFDILYGYIHINLIEPILKHKILLILIVLFMLAGLVFVLKAGKWIKPDTGIGKMFLGFAEGIKSVFRVKKPTLFLLYTAGIWVCYWVMTYTILLAFDFTQHLGMSGGLSTLVFSTLGVIVPAPAGSATIFSISVGLQEIYGIAEAQAKAIGIVMFSSNIVMIILAGAVSYIIMARRTRI